MFLGTGVLIALAFAVLVAVLAVKGIKIISQSETMVIERLGRFNRVLDSGVNIIWPVIDQPREIEWKTSSEGPNGARIFTRKRLSKIDLRETVLDFPQQSVITKDNVVTTINALLYFQIVDPKKVVYEIANLPDAIEKLTQTSLRNVIGEMELDELLSSRDKVNKSLQAILDEASEKWGVKVSRVELQDISLPEDIRQAMEKQMRAERDKRATILESEGVKQSQILTSEGERAAAVNRAEGEKAAQIAIAEGQARAREVTAEAEAEAIRKVAEALRDSGTDPSQYLIAVRYIEALRTMASGGNRIVFMPYEASGVLGAVGSVKELLSAARGEGKAG